MIVFGKAIHRKYEKWIILAIIILIIGVIYAIK